MHITLDSNNIALHNNNINKCRFCLKSRSSSNGFLMQNIIKYAKFKEYSKNMLQNMEIQ